MLCIYGKDFPKPVTPSKVWNRLPSWKPFTRASIACRLIIFVQFEQHRFKTTSKIDSKKVRLFARNSSRHIFCFRLKWPLDEFGSPVWLFLTIRSPIILCGLNSTKTGFVYDTCSSIKLSIEKPNLLFNNIPHSCRNVYFSKHLFMHFM